MDALLRLVDKESAAWAHDRLAQQGADDDGGRRVGVTEVSFAVALDCSFAELFPYGDDSTTRQTQVGLGMAQGLVNVLCESFGVHFGAQGGGAGGRGRAVVEDVAANVTVDTTSTVTIDEAAGGTGGSMAESAPTTSATTTTEVSETATPSSRLGSSSARYASTALGDDLGESKDAREEAAANRMNPAIVVLADVPVVYHVEEVTVAAQDEAAPSGGGG